MSELVVSGLVKRRAALAGEIEASHESLRKMVLDLENLDATITQFDPNFNIANKISRGGFIAAFLVQCLAAIGCTNLRLEDA
jgi:hypothetical protein